MIGNRINWIDHARGLSIILVVMMHSTLGVEKALGYEGWMNAVVSFATPFRIPAFFLISGLLLAPALRKPIATFFDKRVVTLFYLYAVWLTIQFGFKAPGMASDIGVGSTFATYLWAFIQPYGTLWFIYVLPIFFVIARATKSMSPLLVLAIALLAHLAPIHTGWLIIDEVADYFFYFYLGHAAVQHWHKLADNAVRYPKIALAGLMVWALAHGLLLDLSTLPVAKDVFALCGASALIVVAALLRFSPGMGALRWIGRNTVVVYLGFFLPMAITRTLLIKIGLTDDAGIIALLTFMSAVIGSVAMYVLAQKLGIAKFIYRKPSLQNLPGLLHTYRPDKLPADHSSSTKHI